MSLHKRLGEPKKCVWEGGWVTYINDIMEVKSSGLTG